ncbi:MAG: hypothetical protein ACRD4U_08855 [Candidatus Acidiferrales bacterium]
MKIKKFRNYLLAAAGLALLMLSLSGITVHDVAAQASKIQQVFVTNTAANPVPTAAQGTTPVSGAVQAQQSGVWMVDINGTPTVALAGGSSILVDNNAMNPVFVRDRDNPALQPFQADISTTIEDGQFATANVTIANVPPSKRLVIEHVSFKGVLPVGQKFTGVMVDLSGPGKIHFLVAAPQGSVGSFDVFAASQPLRMYADPGTTVAVSAFRTDAAGSSGSLDFNLSGYLVDVP